MSVNPSLKEVIQWRLSLWTSDECIAMFIYVQCYEMVFCCGIPRRKAVFFIVCNTKHGSMHTILKPEACVSTKRLQTAKLSSQVHYFHSNIDSKSTRTEIECCVNTASEAVTGYESFSMAAASWWHEATSWWRDALKIKTELVSTFFQHSSGAVKSEPNIYCKYYFWGSFFSFFLIDSDRKTRETTCSKERQAEFEPEAARTQS